MVLVVIVSAVKCTKSPVFIRACPYIRAFVENCLCNARIFVILCVIMLLGTIKPNASPVNCIKCTVSEHIAHTVYRVIVPPQKELFILEKLHFTSSIAQFCNFVIFGYKLEFFPYNQCFRKGPQLRTWSS